MAQTKGAGGVGTGRWIAVIVGLMCVGAFGGVAWQRGTLDPMVLLLGPTHSDPQTSRATKDSQKKVDPELSEELLAAQFEPEEDAEDVPEESIDGQTAIDEMDEEAQGIRQAGFEEEATPTDEEAEASGPELPAARTANRVREADTARPATSPPATNGKKGKKADADNSGASRGERLMEIAAIDVLEKEGNLIKAQQELSRWFWQLPAERERILPRLNRMAQALYFAPQPQFYDPYVVKPGDQLRVIGQRYKLSWDYLARLNQVDAKKIRMGQKLKVVPGPFSAHVSLSRYELVVHVAGSFVKSYRVGVGKDGTTPIGAFTVKNKMVDPTYYGPEGVIAHDDPQNPLGERWIDIGDSYGIHGTIEPQSIGKSESRGCVRMLNNDVEEVYDFLVIGSEVVIER